MKWMKMNRKPKIRIHLTLLILFPGISAACSCIEPGNLIERRNKSDMVLVGRLVSEAIDTVLEEKEMKFSVRKLWKNGKKEEAKFVTVRSNVESASCGYEINVGVKAMLFVTTEEKEGQLIHRTSLCSGNIIKPTGAQKDSLWMPLQETTP